MGFVFINWICEHYEHCVVLPLFFLTSLPISFLLHFASSLCLRLCFVSFHFYFPLCDNDTLISQNYRLGLSHPSFRL